MSCFIKRILQFKEAIPFSTIYITDFNNADQTTNCQYSWSVDGVCWTGWVSYSDYIRICKNIESDYYLRILFAFNIGNVSVNGLLTKCYNISLDSSNIFLKNFCEEPNLYNPYNNLDCAIQLQQQLSDSVICMLGIPIYYFRVTPQNDTADYTFKEYVLHNVESVKQIKLMIPDGQMPSSNYNLTDFDFDWETDWETEISKTQFASAFGDDAFPKNRDFIYIPMMKRMWSVNSAYDEKNEGLMWQSTTWKLSLVKYNEGTNINTGEFEDVIDGWIENKYDDTFGQIENIEQERLSGTTTLSAPSYSPNNLYNIFMEDAIRSQITKNVKIKDKFICHNNTVIARNMYELPSDSLILYQNGICGEEGSLSFIIDTSIVSEIKTPIINFGNIKIYIYKENDETFIQNCNLDKIKIDENSVYIYNCRWSNKLKNVNQTLYKQVAREKVPVYMLRPEMYHFEQCNVINDSEITDEFISDKKQRCYLQGPVNVSNIKYFNRYLNDKEMISESMKYVTQDGRCVINDLARHINNGNGYSVK